MTQKIILSVRKEYGKGQDLRPRATSFEAQFIPGVTDSTSTSRFTADPPNTSGLMVVLCLLARGGFSTRSMQGEPASSSLSRGSNE